MVEDEKPGPAFLSRRNLLLTAAVLVPALMSTWLMWMFLPGWWKLTSFFWYSIPGNSFLWLPHEPAVIAASLIYAPIWVALVGGLATLIASVIDHALFTKAFEMERLDAARRAKLVVTGIRLFNKRPWWTIVVFAFTPIPFYPMRIVAPVAKYPMPRYVSAVVAGRVPRYFLLALGGTWANYFIKAWWP
ncbi:MAG TPA: VTT domain-containing protein [SAR202 cluster bacterium]|nr:VTT domain-containing protein [SAR202 cluster bacterium]